MAIVPLFCDITDFCVAFEPAMRRRSLGAKQRKRQATMYLSEVLTILVWFHRIGYRDFKRYYTEYAPQPSLL